MLTLNLLRLSLLIIAGFAAISSVAGLGAVFKQILYPIIVLGVGLEMAKYVATAYAYTNWYTLTLRFKTGLLIFISALSIFTSIGIYGYLSDSFSKSHTVVKKDDILINQLQKDQERLNLRILEIDKQIRELPSEFVTGRVRLMTAFADERKQATKRLEEVSDKLHTTLQLNVDSMNDLGPIVSLAKTFGTTVDNAVGTMILFLSFTLDLFALFLTVLINRRVVKTAPKEAEKATEVVQTVVKAPEIVKKVGRPLGSKSKPKPAVEIEAITDWNFK